MSSVKRSIKSKTPTTKPVARKVKVKRRSQAERSEDTQLRLVEAAAVMLRRKGYAGLRTEDIAKAAKVSRGAQQHQFPTKDSLVLATAAHLLRNALERGTARARAAIGVADPIEAIVEDCIDFFLGPDFSVLLDLVLAGSKNGELRDQVYQYTRESRLGVEEIWLDVLCEHGLPRDRAEKILWLTTSIVRGLAVRALWQRDEKLFKAVLDEWRLMVSDHLKKHVGAKK